MIDINNICKKLESFNLGNRELHKFILFQDGSGRVEYLLKDDWKANTNIAFAFRKLAEFEEKAEHYLKELEETK